MPRLKLLSSSSKWSSHCADFAKRRKVQVQSTQTATFHGTYARQTGDWEEGHGFAGLTWGAASLRGGCSRNDDTFVCGKPSGMAKTALFGVFDGHGINGGTHAAKLAAKQLHRIVFDKTVNSTHPMKQRLEDAFVTFDKYLSLVSGHHVKKCKKQETLNRALGLKGKSDFVVSGTCAVVVLVGEKTVTIANLGDSQAIAQNGRLTKLHHCSNPEEAHRIFCNGGYILDDRLNGNLMPTRAFGDFFYKRAGSAQKNVLSCLPEVTEIARKDLGEFLVLGSDGIFDVLPEAAVMKICQENRQLPVSEIAQSIVDKAIGLGSMDNVTCIVIKMDPVAEKDQHHIHPHSQKKHEKPKAHTSSASLIRAMSAE